MTMTTLTIITMITMTMKNMITMTMMTMITMIMMTMITMTMMTMMKMMIMITKTIITPKYVGCVVCREGWCFWCRCPRCESPDELGSNMSTLKATSPL